MYWVISYLLNRCCTYQKILYSFFKVLSISKICYLGLDIIKYKDIKNFVEKYFEICIIIILSFWNVCYIPWVTSIFFLYHCSQKWSNCITLKVQISTKAIGRNTPSTISWITKRQTLSLLSVKFSFNHIYDSWTACQYLFDILFVLYYFLVTFADIEGQAVTI